MKERIEIKDRESARKIQESIELSGSYDDEKSGLLSIVIPVNPYKGPRSTVLGSSGNGFVKVNGAEFDGKTGKRGNRCCESRLP